MKKVGTIAISQCDFPDGIGIEESLKIQEKVIGFKTLTDATEAELDLIIDKSRKRYREMNERKSSKKDQTGN